jgi:hypothetical protein
MNWLDSIELSEPSGKMSLSALLAESKRTGFDQTGSQTI